MTVTLGEGDALLLVDVQRDFLPGGPLAVADGDAVVAPLNRCIALARRRGVPVFASRDWHTCDHCSFRAQGGPWPPHCVAGTPGAAFAPALELPPDAVIVSKATTPGADAYSAFERTDLARQLRDRGVNRLVVGGLATDYCVASTVRDARRAGFEVMVLADAIRAVEATPGDGERACGGMRQAGAAFIASGDCA